jgi:hypothetical protein
MCDAPACIPDGNSGRAISGIRDVTIPRRCASSVFAKSSEATLLLMTPALLGTMRLGHEGLRVWMGLQFAQNSTLVAEILMVGVLVC